MRDRSRLNDLQSDDKKVNHNVKNTEQNQVARQPSMAAVQRAIETGDKRSLTPTILRRLNRTHGAAYVQRLLSDKPATAGSIQREDMSPDKYEDEDIMDTISKPDDKPANEATVQEPAAASEPATDDDKEPDKYEDEDMMETIWKPGDKDEQDA